MHLGCITPLGSSAGRASHLDAQKLPYALAVRERPWQRQRGPNMGSDQAEEVVVAARACVLGPFVVVTAFSRSGVRGGGGE
jgi:hypothetical protein